MHPSQKNSASQLSVLNAARAWWARESARTGWLAATRALFAGLWDFVRNSTPARLRQRYGDAEYDWDHRVNTTSAAVGWRDRLLAVFHSLYQPTDPALFHEMLRELQRQTGLDFRDFTFLDLGSGKGRTLLMASDFPFRRIIGVELLPSLDQVANDNLRRYHSDSQRCFAVESVCGDATAFCLPNEPLLVYLSNPFPESGLRLVLANLQHSLREHPRIVCVLYHNPLLEHFFGECTAVRKIGGTHQYSLFSNQSC